MVYDVKKNYNEFHELNENQTALLDHRNARRFQLRAMVEELTRAAFAGADALAQIIDDEEQSPADRIRAANAALGFLAKYRQCEVETNVAILSGLNPEPMAALDLFSADRPSGL